MNTAADLHLRERKDLKISFEPSEETLELFQKRQILKKQEKWGEVKTLNKAIKKNIRKDERDTRIKYLEEELWYDVKRAKAGYLPKHTKLKKENGEIAKSTERAEVLADFFEKKQWGKSEDPQGWDDMDFRDDGESHPLIFPVQSPIKIDEFTLEELDIVLKREKQQSNRPRRITNRILQMA